MSAMRNPDSYFSLAAIRPEARKSPNGLGGRARVVLAVGPHGSGWAIDRDGEWINPCGSREEAKAAANRMARDLTDTGHPCRVLVHGEPGYFTRGV